jgi:hypothetical protein
VGSGYSNPGTSRIRVPTAEERAAQQRAAKRAAFDTAYTKSRELAKNGFALSDHRNYTAAVDALRQALSLMTPYIDEAYTTFVDTNLGTFYYDVRGSIGFAEAHLAEESGHVDLAFKKMQLCGPLNTACMTSEQRAYYMDLEGKLATRNNFAKNKADAERMFGDIDRRLETAEFERSQQRVLNLLSDTSVVDLSDNAHSYLVDVSIVKGVDAKLRHDLMAPLAQTVRERTALRNPQAQSLLNTRQTSAPPSPIKALANLSPGDVVLVAPWELKDVRAAGVREVVTSIGINWLDRWASDNWSSPASHAATFLGERAGKRWYLDNTSDGPRIRDEKDFLKHYAMRQMDVATLVGQPLSRKEGEELWKAAHEMRNTTTYWPSRLSGVETPFTGQPGMVCSEASTWLLMRAGRRVAETRSPNPKFLGVDIGVNKNQVVSFSPADFYDDQQYFLIHRLSIPGKAERAHE